MSYGKPAAARSILSEAEILSLGPETLPPVQTTDATQSPIPRDLSLAKDFTDDEEEIIRGQYQGLEQLLKITRPHGELTPQDYEHIFDFAYDSELLALENQLEDLSREIEPQRYPLAGEALYKIGGGAFSSLCNYLMLIQLGGIEPEYIQTLYYLALDHSRAMRSIIVDLDPEKRLEDAMPKLHSVENMIAKWKDLSYRLAGEKIEVNLHCYYQGLIAERCLEIAEIDNLFYHLVNNCTQFSSDHRLEIYVAALPDETNLRWVFTNKVAPQHRKAVEAIKLGGTSLFEHGSSTIGEGLGLGILGTSVMHAYGLNNLYTAREQGYFGTTFVEDTFVLWFHWPRVDISV